jgi:hypothetical protein
MAAQKQARRVARIGRRPYGLLSINLSYAAVTTYDALAVHSSEGILVGQVGTTAWP